MSTIRRPIRIKSTFLIFPLLMMISLFGTLLSQMLKSLTIDHLELNIKVFENGPSFLQSEHAKEDVNHFLILMVLCLYGWNRGASRD